MSLLGSEHEAAARRMTLRAVLAVALACGGACVVAGAAVWATRWLLGWRGTLLAYAGVEAVFAVIYWYRYLLLSYQPIKHRPLGHDPVAALSRTMQHLRRQRADMAAFLSIWFHGAPFEAIRRDNVKDLVAYAFWHKAPAEVAAEGGGGLLEQQVAHIEAGWGLALPPGHDPALALMRQLWEPMKHMYRPLAFYASMEAAAALCTLALRAAGFARHSCMGLPYFTTNWRGVGAYGARRQQLPATASLAAAAATAAGAPASDHGQRPQQARSADVPFVFVHGLGMGLVPYISFLFNIAATGRPLLALELPHISMRWVLWVPTLDEVVEALLTILKREHAPSACLVGHSYGTAVASRLLQTQPQAVQQLCLIDPVCFAMFMPVLLRNFLYESPNSGSWLGDFMMVSAARELHVSAALSRRLFWTDVNLWEEQVPPGSLVCLSARDALMVAPEVKHWLEQHTSAVVMYHPRLAHAEFVLDLPWQQQIVLQLLQLLDAPRDATSAQQAAAHASGNVQWHTPSEGSSADDTGSSQLPSPAARGCFRGSAAAAPAAARAPAAGAGHEERDKGAPPPHAPALHIAASCSSHSRGSSTHSFASCAEAVSTAQRVSASSTCSSSSGSNSGDSSSGALQVAAGRAPAAAGGAGARSPFQAAGLGSSGDDSSSNQLPALQHTWPAPASRAASLGPSSELPHPSLGMHSWSSVLPSASASSLAIGCGGDTETDAVSSAAGVESPRSTATFRSATSAQSRRSAAATAAAQEAARVAQLLLQPLRAMQQRQQGQHKQRRHSWDAARQTSPEAEASSAAPRHMQQPQPAGAALVTRVTSARGSGADAVATSAGAAGAASRRGGSGGVLRRVEGLLQRRTGGGTCTRRQE